MDRTKEQLVGQDPCIAKMFSTTGIIKVGKK